MRRVEQLAHLVVVQAVFPLAYVKAAKFWPTVGRVDSAYGDRNLVCSCIPIEEYSNENKVVEV